jgi:ribonucleoside-diphosphate reductase alpha chain
MMARQRLPDRRPSLTVASDWQGHGVTVTMGFDPACGDVREVFADAASGGAMQAVLSDACVLISIALQHGIAPAALAKSLARVPAWIGGEEATAPASPVGAVVEVLLGGAG